MERPLWKSELDLRGCNAWLRHGWLLLLVLVLGGVLSAGATSFTASLDRDSMTLGDSVTLSLRFEDGGQSDAPQLPDIPNLQIGYVGPSSQFSFVNGRTSSSVTHNYTVTARQAGEYTIPAFSVDINGQKFTSQPLKLTVLKPGVPPPSAIASGNEIAFMKLVLPKKQIYLGETMIMELDLYLSGNVRGATGFELTDFPADGLSVGKMAQGQPQQAQVGNSVYRRVPLYFPLTAIKTGNLQLGPANASIVLQVASSRQPNTIFEQMGFGEFGTEQKRVILAADGEAVQSLRLPQENVPPGFNGAVGNYQMTVTVGPTNVTAGDPITVHVQISGRGSLDGVTLPEQTSWQDFKTYPPTSKVEASDQFGLEGTKNFEQIVTPQNSDVHELPSFAFAFFNPQDGAYHVLQQPAVPLTVRSGGNTVMPVVAAGNAPKNEAPAPVTDIVPIKQRLGGVALVTVPLQTQAWFMAVQGVPALAFLGAFVWRKRSDALANNPRLRRHRQVAQVIRDGRSELQRLAAGNHSEEFFATLFRLLQEQLGERLDCPASAITESIVDEQLAARALPEAVLENVRELFQACNVARYAPSRSSQELAALIPKFDNVVASLQNMKS